MADDRMPEAEVSLLLAEHLLTREGSSGHAEVAIDGAGVQVPGTSVFDIATFLKNRGWKPYEPQSGRNEWTRSYVRDGITLRIHSKSGLGDVVVRVGESRFVAECKKGPPTGKKGSPERPLLNNALGQALIFQIEEGDVVIAAVPDTPAFRKIADEWRNRPLVVKSGIKIVLVARDGQVLDYKKVPNG